MKLSLTACLIGSAAAFAPSTGDRASTSLAASEKSASLPFLPAPQNLKGYVGDVGFDPLRISDYFPMDYLREAELKHSRMAMLAWTGFVAVDNGLRVYPLPDGYEGATSATAHDTAVTTGAMGQILLFVGILECLSWISVSQMLQGSGREPGDFGLDPIGFLEGKTEAEIESMKLKELKNGRLAMMAFGGVVTQSRSSEPFL